REDFHIDFNPAVSGRDSTNAYSFTVAPGMNVLDVLATVDTAAEEGTGNLVGIRLYAPDGTSISSGGIPYPVIDTDKRQIVVQNPQAGTWTLEVRGASGLTAVPGVTSPTQVAAPGPVDGYITQIKYILPYIPDIQGHALQEQIESALKNRVIDTLADGTFSPDSVVKRQELAGVLVLNTSVRQSLGAAPKFTDVSGDLARFAEAVTANGSNNRDFDFTPKGMMSFSGTNFNPLGNVNRLDLAVALVKALGHDAEARSKANSTVTFNGVPLTDNSQIPGALRGYVQVAINRGLFEAFPAEVRQIGPGQFQALPGPRFEPNTAVTRAALAVKLNSYRQLFTTGG
ncbi:MAG TPA: PPC domain-containing protein, partial [Pyrinomonadaceae bacterium]|nr:PPC domain-containing protein [Pyrinomonadaceae bacterium]